MLTTRSPRSSRRASLVHLASLLAAGALALSSGGCIALLGVQEAEAEFLVKGRSDGTFFGWSEITVGEDVSSVSRATLVAITLDVEKPVGTPDLSFIGSLKAEAVVGETRTEVANLNEFPKGEQAVVMKVIYRDDLKPLFKDERTIRIEWTGAANPAFTAWPEEGFWIRVRIKVDIE